RGLALRDHRHLLHARIRAVGRAEGDRAAESDRRAEPHQADRGAGAAEGDVRRGRGQIHADPGTGAGAERQTRAVGSGAEVEWSSAAVHAGQRRDPVHQPDTRQGLSAVAARQRAVIFDCDGVLIDSEGLASRVEAELTRELGLNLTTDEAHDLFLGKTVDGVLATIASRSGKTPSATFTYNWAFATAHAFMRELQPVADVREVVGELRARGHPLAVASQSPLARVR